jgi:ABC-2 type transport system permease protein
MTSAMTSAMSSAMTSARVLVVGGFLSYRALFNWLHPSVYIPTMLGGPLFQILFFTMLGRYGAVADDTYFVVGNAVQASAMAGVFGMVLLVVNEREFGTLSAVLATPANRLAIFAGRALPVIANGVVVSVFGLAAGSLLLDVRLPVAALPAIALALVLTAASCAMFGLALAAVGLRVRDLWVGSNLAYYVLLLLCGGSLPASALPGWLAATGEVLPLTHGIRAIRELAAGAGPGRAYGQLLTEVLIGVCYAIVGYALLRLFEAESRRRACLDRV